MTKTRNTMSAKRRYERYLRFDIEQAEIEKKFANEIHLETGAGIVRCGATGWDLSTVSVDLRDVTCSKCKGGK
jgi:hypothetical protein